MGERSRILLADDDEDDLLLLQQAFAQAGWSHSLNWVHDGEEAMLYLTGEGRYADRLHYPMPSLLLLDINMPRKTGFEVLEWIRSKPSLRRLPVIMLSSSSQGPHISRAYELGANSYLVKVPQFGDLVERVRVIQDYWLRVNQPPNLAWAGDLQPIY